MNITWGSNNQQIKTSSITTILVKIDFKSLIIRFSLMNTRFKHNKLCQNITQTCLLTHPPNQTKTNQN